MTLPTFLGIGMMRGGTTWLHELLASHPEVFVSMRRKEVYFFDQYYERGLHWYRRFFTDEVEAERYQDIGEITPGYLHCPRCPERITSLLSITKLILIVRNLIDRSYSHYGLVVRAWKTSESFETFLSLRPQAIE